MQSPVARPLANRQIRSVNNAEATARVVRRLRRANAADDLWPRTGAYEGQAVILYDLDCGFCRWSVAKVIAWDRRARLRVAPIQSSEGERILEPLDSTARLASWHLLTPDGRLRSAGAAFGPLLTLLPGGDPLAALAAARPDAAERAYRWIASRRGSLGRLVFASAKRRADERIERRQLSPLPPNATAPTCSRKAA